MSLVVIKSENKLRGKGLVRIENTPDVLCMAGNKNKFLFAECVAECFWTSSNFKNDPQIRLSSGSFNENGTESLFAIFKCYWPGAFHHFIRYSSPSLASGEDRYTAHPMTNRTGLKTTLWLIDQLALNVRVNFFFLFFLELINGSLFCFYWTNKYDFFFNSWIKLKTLSISFECTCQFFFLILISIYTIKTDHLFCLYRK